VNKLTVPPVAGVFLAGVLLLAAAAWLAIRLLGSPGWLEVDPPAVVQVERRNFVLDIVERGVVEPARISPISSPILSNQAKIVWLIKEGTLVRKGILVARFDTKPFMDSLLRAELAYADAQATFAASEKVLSLQQEEEAGKIGEAERRLEIARIQADNIKNGSGPLQRIVLEQKVQQEQRNLAISRSELADLEALLVKGHISAREKDKVEDKVITAAELVAVAQAELENFDKYAWPKMLREAELLVNGAASDLVRVRRTAELLIQNRAAEVEKNRRLVASRLNELEQARGDVANCDIISPADGLLLYSEIPRDTGRRKVQIGDSVWVGQTFLQVPDTTELVAEFQVREVDVAKIAVGMKTDLEVDAFPGQIFPGEVEAVASLSREDGENLRRFPTRVRFIGDTGRIHVGMSVTARITYAELGEVLAVPISSVAYRDGQSLVRLVTAGEDRPAPVVLGARGRLWVELREGLEEGAVILREGY
jgi:multidrug resistance efflux pump